MVTVFADVQPKQERRTRKQRMQKKSEVTQVAHNVKMIDQPPLHVITEPVHKPDCLPVSSRVSPKHFIDEPLEPEDSVPKPMESPTVVCDLD